MTNTIKSNILFYRIHGWQKQPYYQSYDQIRYKQEKAAQNPFGGLTVFLIVFFLLLLVALLVVTFSEDVINKNILYNDEVLAEYTEKQYENEFSSYANYENNILLVYLFDEDREEYKTTVRIGKNIAPDIAELFEGEASVYTGAIDENLNEFFLGGYYGIEDDISEIIAVIYEKINALGLSSAFITPVNSQSDFTSHITDPNELTFEQEHLNMALGIFTAATGIPVVVLTDYLENVFEVKYSLTEAGILIAVFSSFVLIICIMIITLYFVYLRKGIKKKKLEKENEIRKKFGAPLGEGIE